MHTQSFFIDTHCHLNLCLSHLYPDQEPSQALSLLLQNAQNHRVTTLVDIGTDITDSLAIVTRPAVSGDVAILKVIGLHPDTATVDPQELLCDLEKLVHQYHTDIVGIGECGMDFYRSGYSPTWQEIVFARQIELAITYDKALVVHSRDCPMQTLEILDRYRHKLTRVVMHCYSYDTAYARKLADRGWLLGIGGTYTYPKNHALRAAVAHVGIEHLVLETDAPFLAPQIVRGTRNTPQNIPLIAQAIAQELSIDQETVAYHTTRQAKMLFNSTSSDQA